MTKSANRTCRLALLAVVFCYACSSGSQPPIADGLALEQVQALLDRHYVDIRLVAVDVKDENGRAFVSATAGDYWALVVELEEADASWRVKGAIFDGRPVSEQAPGALCTPLIESINQLRGRNTILGMRYIADGLAKMRAATGGYPASLVELAELGYLDLLQLDEKVTRATEIRKLREFDSRGFFPAAGVADAWGNPWAYTPGAGTYTLASNGWDGSPGPAPTGLWSGSPFDADLIMVDGELVQAPAIR